MISLNLEITYSGLIKISAQGAIIGVIGSLNKMIDFDEHPILIIDAFIILVALNLYLCQLSYTPKIIYKESQLGSADKANGFYIIENNSQELEL